MVEIIRNRNWMCFWVAQIAQELGVVLFQVSGMAAIYDSTGSVLQTAGLLVANTLPPFLLGSFAGAIIDRYPRRPVMMIMNVIRAAAICLLLFFIRDGVVNVWGTYLTAIVIASATTFYNPARSSIIPSLIEKAQLVLANSFNMAVLPLTWAIGFLLGGVLVEAVSVQWIVLVIALCYVTAAALIMLVRERAVEYEDDRTADPDESILTAVRKGVVYLRQHDIARTLVTMEIIEHVPHGIWTAPIMLVFVTQAIGGGSREWGMQNGAFFAAMFVGTLLAIALKKVIDRYPGWMIIINALFNCILTIVYALSSSNAFAVWLAFAFGIPFALRDVAQDSLLHVKVDGNMIGRVFAFREMGRSVMFMFGGLFFAWLAEFVNIRTIYIMGGGLYSLTALYALTSRPLRQSKIIEEAKE